MPNRKNFTSSKQKVLILQGGGSLGAYEAGVFKALYEMGIVETRFLSDYSVKAFLERITLYLLRESRYVTLANTMLGYRYFYSERVITYSLFGSI